MRRSRFEKRVSSSERLSIYQGSGCSRRTPQALESNAQTPTCIHLLREQSLRQFIHIPSHRWHLCISHLPRRCKMDTAKEELKLVESIAAIRMGGHAAGDHIKGVVVVIPAGEVVRFYRAAPLLDQ